MKRIVSLCAIVASTLMLVILIFTQSPPLAAQVGTAQSEISMFTADVTPHISDEVWVPDLLFRWQTNESMNEPENLLVFIFRYNNPGVFDFEASDIELEAKYEQLIFGTGNLQDKNLTVNDFYRENSNDKFYFNPVLFGENTTGIYTFNIGREYQIYDPYNLDINLAFSELENKGFNWNDFEFVEDEYGNYLKNTQVLCIIDAPAGDAGGALITNSGKEILVRAATVNKFNGLGAFCHELGHLLGAVDLYNQWHGTADVMSWGNRADVWVLDNSNFPVLTTTNDRYMGVSPHFSALYKAIWGWYQPTFIDSNAQITLSPAGSPQEYSYAVIETDDPNQYYLIENRQPIGFDYMLTEYNFSFLGDENYRIDSAIHPYKGVNIWRIDKVGFEKLSIDYNNNANPVERNGFTLIGVLQSVGDRINLTHYTDKSDFNDKTLGDVGITVEFLQQSQNDILVEVSYVVNAAQPNITTQPIDQTVGVGTSTSLSVVATSPDGGVLSYQWYYSLTPSISLIPGATNASYNPNTESTGIFYYFVEVINTNDTVNGSPIAAATSDLVTITVLIKEQTPSITIIYEYGILTGFDGQYTFNGGSAVTITDSIAIVSTWFGNILSIVKVGNGATTTDSDPQQLEIAAPPESPTGITKSSNGTITGVTPDMEYRLLGAEEWTPVEGTSLTGLVVGTYEIRTKATESTFAGASIQITIGNPAKESMTLGEILMYCGIGLGGLVFVSAVGITMVRQKRKL